MRHKQRCLRSLVGLAYFFAFCQVLFAGSGLISVKCIDQDGRALKGIKVYLQCLNNGKADDAKTNSEGLARFDKLNAGVYRVWTQVDGFTPAYFEFLRMKDQAQETVTLNLKRGDSDEKLYFQDSEVLAKSEEYAKQGSEFLNQGRIAEAKEALERSLEINRSNPLVYHNLAVIYGRLNRWDESEESLRKELQILNAFKDLQSVENASLERLYQSASQLLDSLPVRRAVSEANAAMQAEDYEAALKGLKEAVQIDSSNAQLHFSMAVAYAKLGRVGEAKTALERALALDPENQSYRALGEQIAQFQSQMAAKKSASALAEVQELNNKSQYQKALDMLNDSRDVIVDANSSAFWERDQEPISGSSSMRSALRPCKRSGSWSRSQTAGPGLLRARKGLHEKRKSGGGSQGL